MASVVNEVDAQVYWAQVPEWVLTAPISDRAVRLYGLLARRAGQGRTCFPSRRWLADTMRCSAASVDRALEELVRCGAVGKTAQFRERRQTVNLYTILAMSSRVTTPLLTGDEPPLLTGDEQKESHREESHKPLAAAPREKKPRRQDPIWDAIVQVCGYGTPPTKTEAGRAQAAGKELREINATPQQIHQVAAAYRRKWPDMPVTPQALTGNWSQLLVEATPRKAWSDTNFCPTCGQDADDIYHEELCDAYATHN